MKQTTDSDSRYGKGSTLGSTEGNVSLTAGENLSVHGSDVVAEKDIRLSGQSVAVTAAENTHTELTKTEQKQSGFTLALSGAAVSIPEKSPIHFQRSSSMISSLSSAPAEMNFMNITTPGRLRSRRL
nr:hemagglutinin repeat-containing protein [Morganella morganii]